MYRGRGATAGYTILETLIFLAVSSLLFVSATALINGRQGKTEFALAVREFERQISDIANEVSSGYYQTNGSFSCQAPGTSRPVITNVPSRQGSNGDCVFAGKVLQFAPSNDRSTYNVYTAAGRRYSGTTTNDTTLLRDSMPVLIASGSTSPTNTFPDMFESKRLPGGMTIDRLRFNRGNVNINGFMMVNTPKMNLNNGDAGVVQVEFVVPTETRSTKWGTITSNVSKRTFVNRFYSTMNTSGSPATEPGLYVERNPTEGVTMCLRSTSSNQHAILTIGRGSGTSVSSAVIGTGACT